MIKMIVVLDKTGIPKPPALEKVSGYWNKSVPAAVIRKVPVNQAALIHIKSFSVGFFKKLLLLSIIDLLFPQVTAFKNREIQW